MFIGIETEEGLGALELWGFGIETTTVPTPRLV
jgi:hypothetical protein